MHMDGGAAETTLLAAIIGSRIHTASQSLSALLFPSFFNPPIKHSGPLLGKCEGGALSQLTHHVQAAVITPEAQVEAP